MKSFRICVQNIRKWTSNSRVWVSFILAVLFVYLYTKGIWIVCDYLGKPMSPWIFTALFNYRYMKIVFMFPIIFTFCDAPFVDSNQPYVMLRTTRRKWSFGQVLYIYLGSFIYFLLLLVSTILVNIGHMRWDTKWGDVVGMVATTNAASIMKIETTTIKPSGLVVQYFQPIQAFIFTFILMWMSFVIIGLVIYVFNVWTNSRLVGVCIASGLVLLTALADGNPVITWFSPISWNSLNNIDVGGITAYPTIDYVLGIYMAAIVVLSVAAVLLGKKQVIEIQPMV